MAKKAQPKQDFDLEFEFEITVTVVYSKRITVQAINEEAAEKKVRGIMDDDGEGISLIKIDGAPADWDASETRDYDGPL